MYRAQGLYGYLYTIGSKVIPFDGQELDGFHKVIPAFCAL